MKAIILARVSTKEQEEKDHSNPAQVRRLKEYADKKQLEELVIFEIAESSTHDTRKKFEKVLNLIRSSKETLALIVETVDRLQRSFKESVVLDDLRKAGKVELHFVRENLVLTKDANSSQLLQWDMAVMFARSYVLQLSDNVKRSIEQKLKRGECIGQAPIGYLNFRDDEDKSKVIVDQDQGFLVVKVFEFYATGKYSMKTISEMVKNLGLTAKSGKALSTSQIEQILTEPFYYGIMEVKGVQYPHNYETLISKQLFVKCQSVRESWNKKPFQYAAKPFIFRGLISCDVCGCTITPETSKGKYTYYSCTNYRKQCKRLYVPEKDLLKPIYKDLKRLELPQAGIDYVVEGLRATDAVEQEFYRHSIAELQAQFAKYDDRLNKLLDDKYDRSITPEMYDKKLKEYKEKQADILQQMNQHSKADENHHLTAARILDICKRAVSIFESSEPNEKRQFLNFILQNCRLKEKSPMFTLKPVFAGIVKAHDDKKWLAILHLARTFFEKSL